MFDQAQVRQWLAIIHGDAPGLIHVCATDAWAGQAFPTHALDDAAAFVAKLDADGREGVYARVTTIRPSAGLEAGYSRGSVADTVALPALWADLDLAGPGHKETRPLPPDVATAYAIVAASGLPRASLWVHSGGGLYPIWRLDPPHVVDGDLADLVDLSANWQKAIAEGSRRHGYHYGTAVGDLARVLRIPGTVNRKEGLARPCRIIDACDAVYTVAELYEAVANAVGAIEVPAAAAPARPPATGDLVSPGDDWADRNDWATILEPHGWRFLYARGAVRYWCRPGKSHGVSATTNATGTDHLHVFTTSTDLVDTNYSKFGALAALEYRGDLHEAARALKSQGYGRSAPTITQSEAIREITGANRPQAGGPVGPAGQAASATAAAPDADGDAELATQVRYLQDVATEARRQRVQREARRRLDAEDHRAAWRPPTGRFTLTEELALPDEETPYRIEKLLAVGANAVLTAQFKAGKTTVCNNLIRALADGTPFLGRFDIAIPDGRIGVWNYEVSDTQYRRWLRDTGVVNTDRVSVLNLRGFRMPMTHPHVEEWIVNWLVEHKITVWMVDPFARAFVGSGEENSNSDVGLFLDTLDVIKDRAGVSELILPTHTGRAESEPGQERSRGATRVDDWADSRWILSVDDQARRFFRAAGRDTDVDEEMLTFDPDGRRLTLGGWDRRGARSRDLCEELVAYVAANPGLGVNEIISGLGGRNRNKVMAGLADAIGQRRIIAHDAPGRKRLHYPLGGSVPTTRPGEGS